VGELRSGEFLLDLGALAVAVPRNRVAAMLDLVNQRSGDTLQPIPLRLKAGGSGIDLVGGSVVIHYDRWWNAAREDQATDRVHRIGQRRAVQVFKLVTEGTLEEKIAAIIERKRQLAGSVLQADDPHLAKVFTREEILDLLRPV